MSNYFDALDLALPNTTPDGQLRQSVLEGIPWAPTPTTRVSYVSSNRVLVVAEVEKAKQIEERLPEKMMVYLAVPSDQSSASSTGNAWNSAGMVIEGYLGRFTVFLNADEAGYETDANNLGKIFNIENGLFDHVIDCGAEPLIKAAIKPPGYYHCPSDETLGAAIEEIPELIGEFEKPRFFDYDPNICAHGRSGVTGCTRCLDACPTDAIISIGENIEVNPYLCQGGGTCASSCPTGAIRYVYPKAEEQLELLRQLTRDLRASNNKRGVSMLVFDNERGRERVEAAIANLPEQVIPFAVEEIGSIGLDFLSCALAYGINQVALFVPSDTPQQVQDTLSGNSHMINLVMEQLDHAGYAVSILQTLEEFDSVSNQNPIIESAATFSPIGNKRNVIRSALSSLNDRAVNPVESVSLPDGSLFGQLKVNTDGCTLCMGCVSVCPGNALQAGGETPALRFIEANCVQCGVCTRACPESVIELDPRLHFDVNAVNSVRTINEESPFLCISCAKPFATKAMITKMTEKLQGHWMFEKPEALKRLQMCEDCRVVDMFDKEDMIN